MKRLGGGQAPSRGAFRLAPHVSLAYYLPNLP